MTQQTTNETTELLPCPFCGGAPVLNHLEPHTHGLMLFGEPLMPDHHGSWTIECCDVGMIKESRSEVIAAWNRRAALPPSSGEAVQPTANIPQQAPCRNKLINEGAQMWPKSCQRCGIAKCPDGLVPNFPATKPAPAAPVADTGAVEPQRCDFGAPEDFNEAHTDWVQEQRNAQVGASIYNGNTVSYMYSKAKNYGDVVLAAHRLIGKPGHVLDTLKGLIAERDALLASTEAPVAFVRQGPGGTWIEMVDIKLMALPDKTPMLIAGSRAPTADSAADARDAAYQQGYERGIFDAQEQLSGEIVNSARWQYIETYGTSRGGGKGFMISCWVPFDHEDKGCGIDAAIAAMSTNTGEGE